MDILIGDLTIADLVGSSGVALLLAAFALNLFERISRDSATYAAMNTIGAGLAACASWMIGYLPFVVLEGVWCFVSLVALFRALAAPQRTTL